MTTKQEINEFIVFEVEKQEAEDPDDAIEAEFLEDSQVDANDETTLLGGSGPIVEYGEEDETSNWENNDANEDANLQSENENEEEEEEQEEKETMVLEKIPTQKLKRQREKNTPSRYLLFDDLVATVVDYDKDGAPIVEFALAKGEEDTKLPVECGICPDVMCKTKIAKHLKIHKVPGTNRYGCIYCDETYKDYKYLAGHARRHMGIRPYVCDPCKLYFSTKQDLRVHNQRRHQTKEHVCEVCGKSFSQNTMLKRHRESTHEKKRRFQCEHCPKAYYKNFSLQEHVRSVHMGKRRMLVCPFCGMQCRDAHKMARHRKQLHLNQEQYVCEVCQEEFTDINYFDAHKRSIQCRNNTRRRVEQEYKQLVSQSENQDDEILEDKYEDVDDLQHQAQNSESVDQFQEDFEDMPAVEEEVQEYGTFTEDSESGQQLILQHPQSVNEDQDLALNDNEDVVVYEIQLDDDNDNN